MSIRQNLIDIVLKWQEKYGVAPSITSAISEYDAAIIIGCSEEDYSACRRGMTAVSRGHDFIYQDKRYQVKANRPSGARGSHVTLVSKANNYDWDFLIWILYDQKYNIQEAWLWSVNEYRNKFGNVNRISPDLMRQGSKIY